MNQEFGGYKIVQRIGVGGMATVYTAVQKSLGRTVVLKTMHEHLREDPSFIARFEREARAAAAMSHENVVQIIDYGSADGTSYIAMEYVNGPDLKKWIEKHGTPPIEIGTLILCDVCAGLAHAHAHHIIHRDIKPANIMLAPTGVPKIADFGLAKQTQESTVLTVHDTMIGTVPYMSPEHATGQHVDERSDIFSFGVVAYELFGGRRPFPGSSSASVIHAIVTLEPIPLADLNPLVTDDLHRIVSKMLQKDPAKRYQTAEEVRKDLELVIDRWGVTRARDLIAEYIAAPEETKKNLTLRRFKDHLNRAHQYKSMGLGKIDDAIREFERARYLAPADGDVARNLELLRAQKPGAPPGTRTRLRSWRALRRRALPGRRVLLAAAGAAAIALAALGARIILDGGTPGPDRPTAVSSRAGESAVPASLSGPVRPVSREPLTAKQVGTAPEPESMGEPRAEKSEPKPEANLRDPAPKAEKPAPPAAEENAGAARPPEPAKQTPAAANGSLEITARPSATFVVNGRVIAENVSAVSLLFPPGAYDVRLENPYYGTKAWSGIAVVSDETKTLAHDFTKEARGAFITVTTNRIPAMIWIDGAPADKWTPQRGLAIAPGLHRVTVKKDGFAVEEGVVEAAVRDGATVELSFTLKEIAGQ